MVMSIIGGHGLEVFGLEIAAKNLDPNNLPKTMPIDKSIAGFAHDAHEIIGFTIIGALVLHVTGALKHHIIDKDGTLRRMHGKAVRTSN